MLGNQVRRYGRTASTTKAIKRYCAGDSANESRRRDNGPVTVGIWLEPRRTNRLVKRGNRKHRLLIGVFEKMTWRILRRPGRKQLAHLGNCRQISPSRAKAAEIERGLG